MRHLQRTSRQAIYLLNGGFLDVLARHVDGCPEQKTTVIRVFNESTGGKAPNLRLSWFAMPNPESGRLFMCLRGHPSDRLRNFTAARGDRGE